MIGAEVPERDGSFELSAAFGTYGPPRVISLSWSSFLQQELHRGSYSPGSLEALSAVAVKVCDVTKHITLPVMVRFKALCERWCLMAYGSKRSLRTTPGSDNGLGNGNGPSWFSPRAWHTIHHMPCKATWHLSQSISCVVLREAPGSPGDGCCLT